MARQIYSVSLCEEHGLSSDITLGPWEPYTIVVRDIEVFFPSILPGALNVLGSYGQTIYWAEVPNPDGGQYQWSQWTGRVVIPPGHTLTLHPTGSACDVTISGYQLTPP